MEQRRQITPIVVKLQSGFAVVESLVEARDWVAGGDCSVTDKKRCDEPSVRQLLLKLITPFEARLAIPDG